jgi:hypothetical protein
MTHKTYALDREFCRTVGVEKPMAAQRWFAIVDYLVKEPPIPCGSKMLLVAQSGEERSRFHPCSFSGAH